MGHYNLVVEEDETAVWEEDEIGKVTHILLVGFITFFDLNFAQIGSRKMTMSKWLPLQSSHHSITVLLL